MISSVKSIFGRPLVCLSLIALFSLLFVSSCSKKTENNDAAKFIGTWTGTSSCSASGGSVTFTAGANGSTFNYPAGTVGTGSCLKAINLTANASGNNFTIPSQTFVDNCGLSYTMTGSGSLSGATLSLTMYFSGAVTATCSFSGTK